MARKNIDRRDYPDPTEPVVDTGPAKSSWARLASVNERRTRLDAHATYQRGSR